jgi:hypothetical protein
MIINEKEYELIKKIEELTITDYEVLKISEDTYFIKTDNIIPMLEDLKYEYDHLLEELEDIKNNDDEREFKTWN